MGFAVSGPASREILAGLTDEDVSDDGAALHGRPRVPGRLTAPPSSGGSRSRASSATRSSCRPTHELDLWRELSEAGAAHGLRPVGDYAVDSLRLEKGYGIWNAEFTQRYTPGESGLDRYIAWDKGPFIGREAAVREREEGAARRLVSLEVDAADAEAGADDGIWLGERLVGSVDVGCVRAPRGGQPRPRLRRSST